MGNTPTFKISFAFRNIMLLTIPFEADRKGGISDYGALLHIKRVVCPSFKGSLDCFEKNFL
jgi:hypothetical protein